MMRVQIQPGRFDVERVSNREVWVSDKRTGAIYRFQESATERRTYWLPEKAPLAAIILASQAFREEA